jgi:hypothetical protein
MVINGESSGAGEEMFVVSFKRDQLFHLRLNSLSVMLCERGGNMSRSFT